MTDAPARGGPGPGPVPEELLRGLELVLRRRVAGMLPGEHPSAAVGDGTELVAIRPYHPGDDVRRIDWNVTARMSEPHVRDRVAERVLTSWIVLDTSPSMTFGTADRRKWDVAEGVALVVAHLGARRGNRVGVVTFGTPDARVVPPRQGRAGLLGALATLRSMPPPDPTGPTSVGEALRRTTQVARRGSLVAIVSDFLGPRDWADSLVGLADRRDVMAIEIRDPREMELPPTGHLALVDPETGRLEWVNTSGRKLRRRFAEAAAGDRSDVAAALRRARVDHVVLSTSGDWLRALTAFLRRRRQAPARVGSVR